MSEHFSDLLRFWARRLPDRLALRFDQRDYTWRELDQAVDELAAGLHREGVRPGDVVGILMSNRPDFIETMLAVFRLGGVVELLNIRFTAAEMVYPIIDAGTSLVVTEPRFLQVLAEAADQAPRLQVVTTERAAGLPAIDDLRVPGAIPPERRPEPGEIALLAYTSGTTGVAKGALLPHRAIIANGTARAVADALTWRDRVHIILPMAFTGGTSS